MSGRRRDDAHAFHEAWERGVPAHGEVADLVHTAERLCLEASAQPSPDFVATLRERVMTEAQTVLVTDPAAWRDPSPAPDVRLEPQRHRARRRLAGLTAAALASVGTVSLVSTSASALPGEMLYPVKTGVENVQLALKDDATERGAYQLDRASERLREAEAIAAKDAPSDDVLAQALDAFTEQAQDGSLTLFDEYTGTADPVSIDLVNTFATQATRSLTGLGSNEHDSEVEAAWEDAAQTVSTMAQESSRLCGTCDTADVDDLVRSVAAAVESTKPQAPAKDEPEAATEPRGSAATAPSEAAPTQAAPRSTRSTRAPAPSPSPSAEKKTGLRSITDPVIGGLLGDDEQVGLVPGLLGGLLGGGR